MTDRRNQFVDLARNVESLPGAFGPELVRLDRELGESLRSIEVPAGLAGRVHAMSAEYLAAPAPLAFATPSPVVMVRQRRTMWARLAVAASLGTLFVLAGRVVMQNGTPGALPNAEPELVAQTALEKPLPGAVEMLLLDRTPNRASEEIAYLFDPDPRESSDMSLYVQTREVTLDDVSVELALLENELSM